jgi:hypothetical protein
MTVYWPLTNWHLNPASAVVDVGGAGVEEAAGLVVGAGVPLKMTLDGEIVGLGNARTSAS